RGTVRQLPSSGFVLCYRGVPGVWPIVAWVRSALLYPCGPATSLKARAGAAYSRGPRWAQPDSCTPSCADSAARCVLGRASELVVPSAPAPLHADPKAHSCLLKDDDSGDHDQNEENSTQKDGEKEKAEREKSQGGSKRKAVVPGPAEHPLQYNYTFWYSRRTPGRPTSSQSYEQNIKQIGTFASVEQFWRFYSHMVRPGDLTGHSDFHLFKEGIKPMWEDDANKNGGKWIIRLRKGLASRCWENLILAMLGEQFMVGEEICGAVVSVRFQEDIISIWNKTASDQATTARIRDTLRRVLNLPPNTIMEYKTHTDSIKDNSSFRNTKITL
uniref:Eukaryotic translation initiation factor 4E type 2 n=1 Tax=Oryctolagus cuniculus TaxID=9986 RepID=A0A5F9D8Y7_RABIT